MGYSKEWIKFALLKIGAEFTQFGKRWTKKSSTKATNDSPLVDDKEFGPDETVQMYVNKPKRKK